MRDWKLLNNLAIPIGGEFDGRRFQVGHRCTVGVQQGRFEEELALHGIVVFDVRPYLNASHFLRNFRERNEHASPSNLVGKNRIGDVELVLDDKAGATIKTAVEVEIQINE